MSKMIPDPETYFRDFIPPRDQLVTELEGQANQENIPIVGPVVGELLYILAKVMNARTILELGTATGYSAIYLARALTESNATLTTLERDENMAARARQNIDRAGLAQRVEIRVGDAFQAMEALDDTYDLIFMDIDKENYARALPHCHRLLRSGGLLVVDNVAFLGAKEFNQKIFAGEQWRSVHLYSFLPEHSPEKDGLALAVRL
jgi:predicted O-methyltransferase YrrM